MPSEAMLVRRGDGLALCGDGMVLVGDFSRMARRVKPANLNRELIVRGARLRGVAADLPGNAAAGHPDNTSAGRPTAVDATAGLGEDAFLLAAAGFEVTLFERNPTIFALLEDAIDRARQDPQMADIAARMHTREADSLLALPRLSFTPDIVLLDPMFPQRRKSAAVKKKLQLLQQLELPCKDEAALLDAALAANPRKVIVKRPVKGPCLAGRKPAYSLSGKAVRIDCYLP